MAKILSFEDHCKTFTETEINGHLLLHLITELKLEEYNFIAMNDECVCDITGFYIDQDNKNVVLYTD